MIIYPAIDIRQGRCVRLHQGQFDQETVYGDDPLEIARRFSAAGSQWLHVVDLDGAKGGASAQCALIWTLTQAGASIQTGGGIRDATAVTGHFQHGIGRVVVGSLALGNPDLVKGWIKQHGGDLERPGRRVWRLNHQRGDLYRPASGRNLSRNRDQRRR